MHVLYEDIFTGDNRQPPVIVKNIYRFNGNGWHTVLHHASPVTDISTKDDTGDPAGGAQTLH